MLVALLVVAAAGWWRFEGTVKLGQAASPVTTAPSGPLASPAAPAAPPVVSRAPAAPRHLFGEGKARQSEVLGGVTWLGEAPGVDVTVRSTGGVEIVRAGQTLALAVGQPTGTLNGQPVTVSAAPEASGGVTLVPLASVATLLGGRAQLAPSYATLDLPEGNQVLLHLVRGLLEAIERTDRQRGGGAEAGSPLTIALGPGEYIMGGSEEGGPRVRAHEGRAPGMKGNWALAQVSRLDQQGRYAYQGAAWLMHRGSTGGEMVALDEGVGIPAEDAQRVPPDVLRDLEVSVASPQGDRGRGYLPSLVPGRDKGVGQHFAAARQGRLECGHPPA